MSISMFLESPWPIVGLGAAIEIVLLIALLITRRGVILWMMLGGLALVGVGMLVEYLVQTDHEMISDAIYDGAMAAENNNVERLLSYLSPKANIARQDVYTIFNHVEMQMVRPVNVEIKVNRQTNPRTAKVELRVIGKYRNRQGDPMILGFAENLTLLFRYEDRRWLVYGAEFPEVR